jgi:imidazolonepropionase-like amidohydrolase
MLRNVNHRPAGGALSAPNGARRIDLTGKTMPALIDTHSHLGYTDVGAMSH